jgi:hypothetical protein
MKKPRVWNRRWWGVVMWWDKIDPVLLRREWDSPEPGGCEPPRPLMFTTRAAARRWCAEVFASKVPSGMSLRVKVVRVEERVEVTECSQ